MWGGVRGKSESKYTLLLFIMYLYFIVAESEVVELLLTLAIPRSDVKQPAKRLLQRFGSLRGS